MSEPKLCRICGVEIGGWFRYCPKCGCRVADSGDDDLEVAFNEVLRQERDLEQIRARLWRGALIPLCLFGALLLTLPDALLLLAFRSRVALDLSGSAQFLACDAMSGMVAIMLVYFCMGRGIAGELLLAAVRTFQIPMLTMLGLSPFAAQHSVLSFTLFALLPLTVLSVSALAFRVHLSTAMDIISCKVGGARAAELMEFLSGCDVSPRGEELP